MTAVPYDDISGVILVGGKSSRMGRDKAFLELEGSSILDRILEAFRECFSSIALGGNRPERFTDLDVPVHPDLYPGSALGGIYTALMHAETPYIFVSSCDIPFPNRNIIHKLCSYRQGSDVVVMRKPEGCEPLFALYSKACLEPIRRQLIRGQFCAYAYYPQVRTKYVPYWSLAHLDPKGTAFLNVNTPQEYSAIGGTPWK